VRGGMRIGKAAGNSWSRAFTSIDAIGLIIARQTAPGVDGL
jgi:hypothetical protein